MSTKTRFEEEAKGNSEMAYFNLLLLIFEFHSRSCHVIKLHNTVMKLSHHNDYYFRVQIIVKLKETWQ